MDLGVLKRNVISAALIGLAIGILVDVVLVLAARVPVLGCLTAPVALLFGLALPVLIGAMAAAWSRERGLIRAPSGIVDGAIAAALAELVGRVIGFCASLSRFLGPRFLLHSVEQPTRAAFSGVWEIGWLIVSIVVAAVLGAVGGLIYNAYMRR